MELLQVRPGEMLADLACGAGGPGLWMARETGALLTGVDPSPAGLAAARDRAAGALGWPAGPGSSTAPSSTPAFPAGRPGR